MAAVKAEDNAAELGGGQIGETLTDFRGYDLTELPLDARPRVGDVHTGKHGYTLRSRTGAVLWIEQRCHC